MYEVKTPPISYNYYQKDSVIFLYCYALVLFTCLFFITSVYKRLRFISMMSLLKCTAGKTQLMRVIVTAQV